MKTLWIFAVVLFSTQVMAKDICIDLRFDSSAYICQKELNNMKAAVATSKYSKAWYEHSDCVDSFIQICRDLRPGNDQISLCEEIIKSEHGSICGQERVDVAQARNKVNLRKLQICLTNFEKSCKTMRPTFPY